MADKNKKGEYLPDVKPHQIRYRQFDPSECTTPEEKGYTFTVSMQRKDHQFIPDKPRFNHIFREKSNRGLGVSIPLPPSYKKSGQWANQIQVFVCKKKSTQELAVQSVREEKTVQNLKDIIPKQSKK